MDHCLHWGGRVSIEKTTVHPPPFSDVIWWRPSLTLVGPGPLTLYDRLELYAGYKLYHHVFTVRSYNAMAAAHGRLDSGTGEGGICQRLSRWSPYFGLTDELRRLPIKGFPWSLSMIFSQGPRPFIFFCQKKII